CREQILLSDRPRGKLSGQRPVRLLAFREHHHSARHFIQAMDNRQSGPSWLAVTQPFENAFTRKRRWCVRVPSGRFLDHQQIVILKKDEAWKALGTVWHRDEAQ